jgi:hypothetical protein
MGSWGAWIHADALVSLVSAAMVVAFNRPGQMPGTKDGEDYEDFS